MYVYVQILLNLTLKFINIQEYYVLEMLLRFFFIYYLILY